MIPITILTGFLGAGKTTILNQILKQHPDIQFGLIINEFGEEGIDGKLIEASGEEMVEMSNGCVCCVVRKDLQDAALKLIESGKVNYVIIETSGLAEPIPVAQTFAQDDLSGQVKMDAILCVVDCENFDLGNKDYEVGMEQLLAADVVIVNKINSQTEANLPKILEEIKKVNPYAAIVENRGELDTSLLVANEKWDASKLDNEEEEHEHHHEHDMVDEFVFVTNQPFDAQKLNEWMVDQIPKQVVRSKGFLKLELFPGQTGTFLFQMVGANRNITPFTSADTNFDHDKSKLVFIGKDLDRESIREGLENCVVKH